MHGDKEHTTASSLNVAILFRDPWLYAQDQIARRHAEAGYPDIRHAHGTVFQYVEPEGTRVSVLAERAGMTKQSMAELVGHLEDNGYLERIPDPTDKRAKLIRETARGREVVKIARRAIADMERDWAKKLGDRKMEQLRKLLEELNDGLDASWK